MTDAGLREHGFTITESLVTMAIVALIAVSVVPFSGSVKRSIELETAAAETAGLLRRTGARARLSGQDTAATFNALNRAWSDSSGIEALTIRSGIDVEIFAAGGGRGDATSLFVFFAAGGSSGGRVRVSSTAGSFTVSIDWLSGTVAVLRGDVQ